MLRLSQTWRANGAPALRTIADRSGWLACRACRKESVSSLLDTAEVKLYGPPFQASLTHIHAPVTTDVHHDRYRSRSNLSPCPARVRLVGAGRGLFHGRHRLVVLAAAFLRRVRRHRARRDLVAASAIRQPRPGQSGHATLLSHVFAG